MKVSVLKFVSLIAIITAGSSAFSQGNWALDSVAVNDTVFSCNNTTAMIHTNLSCINWTEVIQSSKINDNTIEIDLTIEDPYICFQAVSSPEYAIDLGQIPDGVYTLIVKSSGTHNGVYSTMSSSLVSVGCRNEEASLFDANKKLISAKN